MMTKLGFTTVTFRKKSRREVCEIAARNGISYLEWGGDVHLPPEDDAALSEVLSLQKEFGIQALSYGSYYRLGMENDVLWTRIVEVASQIGAKTIRIWAGDTGSAKTDAKTYGAMVREAKRLADAAAEKNLTVAFEFHHRTYNDSKESSLRLLQDIAKENVRTYWQPFTEPQDANMLEAVLPYLATVHVFTWARSGLRFPLSFGQRRWKKYIEIAKSAPHDVPYIMEFVRGDSEKQFRKDVTVLKRWLEIE